jgi:hypothetical protein
MCVACATATPVAPYYRTTVTERAKPTFELALEAARRAGYVPTLIGEPRGSALDDPPLSFVAVPPARDTESAVSVAYYVHVVRNTGTRTRYLTSVTVTPFAYRGDIAVAAGELPPSVVDRAKALLAAISDRVAVAGELRGGITVPLQLPPASGRVPRR